MQTFLRRFADVIHGSLSGFDRVRFRGTQRLVANLRGLGKFLAFRRILLKDFTGFAKDVTASLKQDVIAQTEALGRPVVYLNGGSQRKEEVAMAMAREHGITDGLIGVWSAVEPCRTFEVGPNRQLQKLELRAKWGKCLHYYHYFLDRELGPCYLRMQTWYPFTCLRQRSGDAGATARPPGHRLRQARQLFCGGGQSRGGSTLLGRPSDAGLVEGTQSVADEGPPQLVDVAGL